ncbi:MAG: DUF5682 family protein, partial [Verrucomicrobiota bacterium]
MAALKAQDPGLDFPDVQLSDRTLYFPVRHHSPACSWHVQQLIREWKPDTILIEGPADATALIPLLTDPSTRAPIALYASFARKGPGQPTARHGAYYPFCDFSPELVALREGQALGAALAFIDLSFPEMVLAEDSDAKEGRNRNLLDESYFKHSALLRQACQEAGARDPDDLWDCLFESHFQEKPAATFIREVTAYCAMARRDQAEETLEADGTLAREARMQHAIATATGRVLVVTGGFHTVAMAHGKSSLTENPTFDVAGDSSINLIRYSFPQLDRLNGYASGMPSPDFYHRFWHSLEQEQDSTVSTLIDLARELRRQKLPVSPADEIAAVSHVRRLANLRGHPHPTREDLLDGVRSVFIKGEYDVEGAAVLSTAQVLLAGKAIGEVPPGAGQPPLLTDFQKRAEDFRMDVGDLQPKEAVLDLYRRRRHREQSRFFQRLRFLEIPFADWVRGPDFVGGTDLDRVQEVWKWAWLPATEAGLIDRSMDGNTLEEAAGTRLLREFSRAEDLGQGRDAALATR